MYYKQICQTHTHSYQYTVLPSVRLQVELSFGICPPQTSTQTQCHIQQPGTSCFSLFFAIDSYPLVHCGLHIYMQTQPLMHRQACAHTHIVLTHTVTEGHAFVHVIKTGASFFVSPYSCANEAQIKQRKANLHGRILNAKFYPPITLQLMCKTK